MALRTRDKSAKNSVALSTASEGGAFDALSTASEGGALDDFLDFSDDDDPAEKAATIAYKLNTATDALNETLERAEQRLASLNLGVSATVTLDEDDGGGFEDLVFQRQGAAWRLVVLSGSRAYDECESHPLLATSRETRTLAATKLDELLNELFRVAAEQIARVHQAVEQAEAFADKLPKAGKE